MFAFAVAADGSKTHRLVTDQVKLTDELTCEVRVVHWATGHAQATTARVAYGNELFALPVSGPRVNDLTGTQHHERFFRQEQERFVKALTAADVTLTAVRAVAAFAELTAHAKTAVKLFPSE